MKSTSLKSNKKSNKSSNNLIRTEISFRSRFFIWLNNNMAVFIFLLLFIYNSLTTPNFFHFQTIINLVNQSTSLILVALGSTLVISAGCIDISLGSGFAWNALIFAMIIQKTGNVALALFAAIISATIIGIINGTLVARFRIQAMIATMATLYIFRSLSRAISNSSMIRFRNEWLGNFLLSRVFGAIPKQFFMITLATIFVLVLVRRSKYGVYFEACGDNYLAANTAGLKTVLYTILAYVICNIFTALGGILDASVINSVDPVILGQFFEFRAIAAAVIGGTPITGGKPNIIGTVFGVFILKIVNMMINMNNISAYWSFVVTAIIIIGAIIIQNLNKLKEKR